MDDGNGCFMYGELTPDLPASLGEDMAGYGEQTDDTDGLASDGWTPPAWLAAVPSGTVLSLDELAALKHRYYALRAATTSKPMPSRALRYPHQNMGLRCIVGRD